MILGEIRGIRRIPLIVVTARANRLIEDLNSHVWKRS